MCATDRCDWGGSLAGGCRLRRWGSRRRDFGRLFLGGHVLSRLLRRCALEDGLFARTAFVAFFAAGGFEATAFGLAGADAPALFPAAQRFRCAAAILSRASALSVLRAGALERAPSCFLPEPLGRPGPGFADTAVSPSRSWIWVKRTIHDSSRPSCRKRSPDSPVRNPKVP